MDLKELMGDSYKEGMSKEEVQAFFKKQVLSSGEYENKGKADADKKALNTEIETLKQQLKDKMSEEEKKKTADDDNKKLIESLQKQLAESQISSSKSAAISALAEAKIKAGIKDEDKDYEDFISEISSTDNEKTSKISKYISKIVLNAYESGKTEAIKNKLGKMGSFKDGQDGKDGGDEKGSFGRELAKSRMQSSSQKEKKNFFERK